jgi:hypothetical protein
MRTKTTLLAFFCYRHGNSTCNRDSITTSTLAVKKKSTITTKKSTVSKKTKALKPVLGAVQQQVQAMVH